MAIKKKADAKEAEVVKSAKKVSTKAVKKDVAKVVKSVLETAADLRKLTVAELHAALKTAREDLLATQKMLRANELPSSHVIRKNRRQIARIHLVLTEKLNEEEAK
jgi:ribosomal protein L29